MPIALRCLLTLFLISTLAHAQPRDTLTTEELLQRRGTAYAALLRPARYLALDVNQTLGGFRRYRIFEGDEIRFKARGERYRETLYAVSDSTFTVLIANEVMNRDEPVAFRLDEVQRIYLSRRIPFVTAAGNLFPIAGGVYVLASLLNDNFLAERVLPVTGALVVSGLIFNRLSNPRFRINKRHRLRVLRTY